MTARIIDGLAIAKALRRRLRERGRRPGLAVLSGGRRPLRRSTVANKLRACEECGVRSTRHLYRADTPEAEVLAYSRPRPSYLRDGSPADTVSRDTP